MEGDVFGFNSSDADAIIRLIDNSGDGGGGNKVKPLGNDFASARFLCVATTGIPARTGTTLGSATVAVKYLGFSGGARVILDAGFTITANNLATTAVATGAYIIVGRIGDAWLVDWEACP